MESALVNKKEVANNVMVINSFRFVRNNPKTILLKTKVSISSFASRATNEIVREVGKHLYLLVYFSSCCIAQLYE